MSWIPEQPPGWLGRRKLDQDDREDFLHAADSRHWDELERICSQLRKTYPFRSFLASIVIVWLKRADYAYKHNEQP